MILCWQQIPSIEITLINCNTKFDGIVFDCEHGNFNNETLYSLIQVTISNNKKALVRITDTSKSKIRSILDAGASGIIFSTIETEDQLKNIFEYSLYPSLGGRRGQGLVAENMWGKRSDRLQNVMPILIPQIETIRGINLISNIDLGFYPHLHSFLIGPYDLSADIGDVGNWENPDFISYIKKYENACPVSKRSIHIVSDIEKNFFKYKDYPTLAIGMDTLSIMGNNNKNEELIYGIQ